MWRLLLLCSSFVLAGCGKDDADGRGSPNATGGAGGGGGQTTGGASGTGSGGSGGGSTGGSAGGTPIPGCPSTTATSLPSVDDERATYQAFGWTWSPDVEPNYPSEVGFAVGNPDLHGDTEGDDLWANLFQYQRSGQKGFLDRATAWADYFKNDYRACVGDSTYTFCYDRDTFGLDHLWGWGLIAWSALQNDPAALTEAEAIGDELDKLYGPNSPFSCQPCTYYGLRQGGRHLLFTTRLAEATGDQKWIDLRDRIIDDFLTSGEWDPQYGVYFYGEENTDNVLGAGSHDAGARIVSAFQLGVLSEGFDAAYRATGRVELRDRMVALAHFVDQYAMDPTYDYAGSYFGFVDGKLWHNYSEGGSAGFWDPSYTTSLVNTLVRGCIYAGEPALCNRAKHVFGRGNRGLYGEPTQTAAGPTEVHHFVDTRYSSATEFNFFEYNKGELQYTYLLFDPCVRDMYDAGP